MNLLIDELMNVHYFILMFFCSYVFIYWCILLMLG